MRISTTLRVALLAALLAIASNLAVIGFIYWRMGSDAEAELRDQVTEEAAVFRDAATVGGRGALDAAIADAARDPRFLGAVLDAGGRRLAGNADLARAPRGWREGYALGELRPAGRTAPVDAGYVLHRLDAGHWLLSGRGFDERLTFQLTLERSLALALAIAVLIGILCGVAVGRYVGRRVDRIAAAARRISGGEFAHRVPLSGASDAFDALAREINHMLDRIAALMQELRMLTDCLAHDLRSPVGRLRARVDAALRAEDPVKRDLQLGGVLREADALMRILSTVLEIGRSEAMTSRDQFQWIDPTEFVAQLADMYEPLIEETGTSLRLDSGPALLPLFGHRQLLAQALSNLLDNAYKYGGGGEIALFARQEEGQIRMGVADRGPGIAGADLAEARRRFGRLDSARPTEGAGLGLALAQAVAHLHNGTLDLADNRPGLEASLLLPTPV